MPPTFFVVRAHAAREQDDRDGAREAFEGALAHGLLELPPGPTWTMSLTWAADIGAWLEDRPRAARLYGLLAAFPNVMTWQYGPVGRALGRLALTLGRPDEAEQLPRHAVALCERIDARAFLAMPATTSASCCSHRPRAAGSSTRRGAPPTSSACRASPSGQPRTNSERPVQLGCSSSSTSRRAGSECSFSTVAGPR